MFPPIERFASGYLSVLDGHGIDGEAPGNSSVQSALYLHGGPVLFEDVTRAIAAFGRT